PAAATAQVRKRAGRLFRSRRGLQHLKGTQLIKFTAAADDFRHYGFARQGAVNKLDFSVSTGNTPAIMAQGFNLTTHGLLRQNLAAASTHSDQSLVSF